MVAASFPTDELDKYHYQLTQINRRRAIRTAARWTPQSISRHAARTVFDTIDRFGYGNWRPLSRETKNGETVSAALQNKADGQQIIDLSFRNGRWTATRRDPNGTTDANKLRNTRTR